MLGEEYILIFYRYQLRFGLNESRMAGTGAAEQQNPA
jgi:hypothetical protein